ncbi:MAG: hypothetical protein WD885_00785 [Candidatus Saccharimonadales bacterium]
MGEVLRTVTDEEMGRYMPFDELLDSGCREVYEAAGEHLMLAYEIDGEISTPVNLLVNLRQGREVVFSLGACISIDSIKN